MPLAFQRIPVSFYQGLDTKSDPKQVVQGRLLELENGIFVSPGQIKKRPGLDIYDPDIESGDTFESGSALATYNEELLVFTGEEVYTRLPSSNQWLHKGSTTSIITRTDQVVRNGYIQSNPDLTFLSGTELYAWSDSRGGIRYTIFDAVTRTPIVADTEVTPVGEAPGCVALGEHLYVTYTDGNTLKRRLISTNTPTQLSSEAVWATDVNPSGYAYDTVVVGGRIFAAYNNTSNHATLKYIDITGSQSSDVTVSGSTGPVGVWSDSNRNIWVAHLNGTSLQADVYDYDLTHISSGTVATVTSTLERITGVSSAPGASTIYYELDGPAGDTTNHIDFSVVSVVTGVSYGTDSGVFNRGLGLISKPVVQGNTHYFWTVHPSSEQATYFCLNSDGDVVSKANSLVAGQLRSNRRVTNMQRTDSGVYRFAGQQRGRLISEDNVIFFMPGISSTELDFASSNQFLSAEAADNLHVVGGILNNYDGVNFNEHGFHLYPEGLSVTYGAGAGPGAGSYQYVACYEWQDHQGQIHRSLPTVVPVEANPAGGQSVIVSVPTLRLTGKESTPVQIAIFRTEDLGDLYYRVTSPTGPLFNTSSVDTVTYTDTLTDADLISRELLYTAGGVLGHDSPPTNRLIATFGERVWLGGLEDGRSLWYSKLITPGNPVGFSANFTLQIDPYGGAVTALGVLDSNLVVFKRGAIFVVNGAGPNNLGIGSDFQVTRVHTDVGCINPNSVVITPPGLMFQSAKGIYLLGRGLQIEYIGAPVEGYNDLTISSATLVGDTNQVRFTTSEGRCLVYDYAVGQWSTFTNYAAVDSLTWNDEFVLLRSSGRLGIENPDSFTDDGDLVRMKISTGWLSFAGLQGFQRVRRMYVLGEHKGDHQLRVRFAFDGAPFSQESIIDVTDVMALQDYGEATPYGEGVYGGEFPLYQFRVDPQTQKCSMIRVLLEDVEDGSPGESMSLSSLSFEVGLKQGGPKLNVRRQSGASGPI